MQKQRKTGGLGIEFEVCPVEELNFPNSFNVVFCNSTFQWFKSPEAALKVCFRALRSNGTMAIQAAATKNYCPTFVEATKKVAADPSLSAQFAAFNPPWTFLDTSQEYTAVFEGAGFEVLHASIDQMSSLHTPEEVFKIFDSGASAGYLNPQYYSCPISEEYRAAFRKVMLESFEEQANCNGKVNLVFYRIFLVAMKPQ